MHEHTHINLYIYIHTDMHALYLKSACDLTAGDTISRGTGPGQMGDALPIVDLGTVRMKLLL